MSDRLLVTTSWDDGHPSDERLAELLSRYGIAATFYVPSRNSEGRPVLDEAAIRRLTSKFEIGGHSIDHVVLHRLPPEELARQVNGNKRWLEDVSGKPVRGFCYVRGRYNNAITDAVRRAGFEYARTTENFRTGIGDEPHEIPATLQFYPHPASDYVKMLLRGPSLSRARLFLSAVGAGTLTERVRRLADQARMGGGYFHLWGHSWELDERDLWGDLETALAHLAALSASTDFVTNLEAVRRRWKSPAG
jgi:peptidoglycan/xylan/chitin deacetylase (PgdA/CDA1 family)